MSRIVFCFLVAIFLTTGCAAGSGAGEGGGDSTISQKLLTVFDSADPRKAAESRGVETSSHGVRVDVQTQGLTDEDRSRFDVDGVHVHQFSPKYERVAVSVRDQQALRDLADIGPVRRLAPEYGRAGNEGGSSGGY